MPSVDSFLASKPVPERQFFFSDSSTQKICLLVILIGIALRIAYFMLGRGLWMDEAALALSIREYGFVELATRPLLHMQNAPLGFMLLAKAASIPAGLNEYGLRLLSLVTDCCLLVLTCAFSRRVFDNLTTLAATVTVSFFFLFVYYAQEFKQYSAEATASMLLLYLYFSGRGRVVLFFTGLAAMLFSSPVVFLLFGLGIGMFYREARLAGWYKAVIRLLPVGIGWLLFFAAYYLAYLKPNSHPGFYVYWEGWFFPTSNISAWTLAVRDDFARLMGSVVLANLALFILAGAVILGFLSLWQRNRLLFTVTTAATLSLCLASAFKMYPLYPRLLHFILPLYVLCLCNAVSWTVSGLLRIAESPASALKVSRTIAAGVLLVLAAGTATHTGMKIVQDADPSRQRGIKHALPEILEYHARYQCPVYTDYPNSHILSFYTGSGGLRTDGDLAAIQMISLDALQSDEASGSDYERIVVIYNIFSDFEKVSQTIRQRYSVEKRMTTRDASICFLRQRSE